MSDNEPAFPNVGNSTWGMEPCYGLTKREWFAGVALQGLLSNPNTPDQMIGLGWKGSKDMAAEYAFAHADAMLAASKEVGA